MQNQELFVYTFSGAPKMFSKESNCCPSALFVHSFHTYTLVVLFFIKIIEKMKTAVYTNYEMHIGTLHSTKISYTSLSTTGQLSVRRTLLNKTNTRIHATRLIKSVTLACCRQAMNLLWLIFKIRYSSCTAFEEHGRFGVCTIHSKAGDYRMVSSVLIGRLFCLK